MLKVLLASNKALFNVFYKTFNEFQERHDELYQLDVTNDELKAIFQKHAVKTPIFRKRPEWDCSTCRSVLVNIAKVVAIDDNYNKVSSFEKFLEKYDLSNYLFLRDMFQEFINLSKTKDIRTLWNSKGSKIGTAENIEPDTGLVFHHFYVDIDGKFVQRYIDSVSNKIHGLMAAMNNYADHLNILQDVMWLIEEGYVYRGTEKIKLLSETYKLLEKYQEISKQKYIDPKIFAFKHVDSIVAYFNSDVISTLINDIISNSDIEAAVERYNKKVAPANYMQSKTTFVTPTQIRETERVFTQLGYNDFINGFKYAEPQDIRILDIIWTNRQVKGGSLSNLLQDNIKPVKLKKNKVVATITFTQFLELLKDAKQVEIDKNSLQKVILIKDTFDQPIYKWNNHISFCYETGLADADFVTKKVKEKGGVVDALIRFSLWWKNLDDLDLHLRRKDGVHIYYGNKTEDVKTGFRLDIDMNVDTPVHGAVENIFSRKKNFEDIGQEFVAFVHNYKKREKKNKCILTVYIDNQPIYVFKFMNPLYDESITFIKFKIDKDYKFIPIWLNNEYLKSSAKLDISNANFIEVDTVLLSPNYWEANKGNKHIFFLKKEESIDIGNIRPYNVEQLKPELLKHKKVLQILSEKINIQGNPQLVGYGISFARERRIPIRINGKPMVLVIDPIEKIKGERSIVKGLTKDAGIA